MLTLKQRVISDKRRGLAEPDGYGAAHSAVYRYRPMACESLVADAMRHLLAAFVMIQNPSRSSRTYDGSANALDLANENICTVLERLNECSYAFWMLPKGRNLVLARVHEYCDVFKRKYRVRRLSRHGARFKAAVPLGGSWPDGHRRECRGNGDNSRSSNPAVD